MIFLKKSCRFEENIYTMAKKSLSEEAKDLFSSWKSEIEDRDGDILARKKKRDEEDEKFKEEFNLALKEVTDDVSTKTKNAYELLERNFKGFTEAVKDGSASVYQKLEIEKHAAQLSEFLNKLKTKGAEKLKSMTDQMKEKMSDYDEELVSEVDVDTLVKKESDELDLMIKYAQEEFENKQ